jgi:hypothetical protein
MQLCKSRDQLQPEQALEFTQLTQWVQPEQSVQLTQPEQSVLVAELTQAVFSSNMVKSSQMVLVCVAGTIGLIRAEAHDRKIAKNADQADNRTQPNKRQLRA